MICYVLKSKLTLPEIDCLCSQQAIALVRVGQRQGNVRALILGIGEVKFVNLWLDFHITKRPSQYQIVNAQRERRLRL